MFPILLFQIFYLIMSVYVWCMCAWVQGLQKAEEDIISSGARLTGSCELLDVGAGTQTQDLCKN